MCVFVVPKSIAKVNSSAPFLTGGNNGITTPDALLCFTSM